MCKQSHFVSVTDSFFLFYLCHILNTADIFPKKILIMSNAMITKAETCHADNFTHKLICFDNYRTGQHKYFLNSCLVSIRPSWRTFAVIMEKAVVYSTLNNQRNNQQLWYYCWKAVLENRIDSSLMIKKIGVFLISSSQS